MTCVRFALAAILLGAGGAAVSADSPGFYGLSYLNPAEPRAAVGGLSRNGAIISGRSASNYNHSPAVTWVGGVPLLIGGGTYAMGEAASNDGTTVVGLCRVYVPGNVYYRAFRWSNGQFDYLPALDGGNDWSNARSVTPDGTRIVGSASSPDGSRAVIWEGTTVTALAPLPGDRQSAAWAVSADGSVVTGCSWFQGYHATRWVDGVPQQLAEPANGHHSDALAVSADGSVAVGYTTTDDYMLATRWSGSVPLVLGDLPGGSVYSIATGVSADGGVVVGQSDDGTNHEPFVWTPTRGMRALRDVLLADHGVDVGGWNLETCAGVSDDGRVIVGSGINPQGQSQGWVAVVPEPSVALGVLLVACWRRRGACK